MREAALLVGAIALVTVVAPAQAGLVHGFAGSHAAGEVATGDAEERLGYAVDVDADGTTLVAGAVGDTTRHGANQGTDPGWAYVYTRPAPAGPWTQQARLAASDGSPADFFGSDVAISADGDTVLVGAQGHDKKNDDAEGAAYVFEREAGSWEQKAKLDPGWTAFQRGFGRSLDLDADGDTAVVAATNKPSSWGSQPADLHLYERTDGAWSLTDTVDNPDANARNLRGWQAAISDDGETVAGAASAPRASGTGAAYVYDAGDGALSATAGLVAPQGEASFGDAVDLDGDTLIVGAPRGGDAGRAYVFDRSPTGTWGSGSSVSDPGAEPGGDFGRAVAVRGGLAAVGAPGAGTAHLLAVTPAGGADLVDVHAWDEADGLGNGVAVSDTAAVLGAPGTDTDTAEAAGAVYAVPGPG